MPGETTEIRCCVIETAELERLSEYAREVLRLKIRDYFDCVWAAGWIGDGEFSLWRDIESEDGDFKVVGPLPDWRKLIRDAGGWWIRQGDDDRERFIPLAEWVEVFEARKRKRKGEDR